MSFYRGCQEALSKALAAAQLALDSCELVLARAHNDAQPVARLPVELVQDIFEYVVASKTYRETIEPFLCVSHRWRCIALSYAKLWSNIRIAFPSDYYFGMSAFGTFSNPASPLLRAHINRSKHAPLCVRIEILDELSEKQERHLHKAVRLLYAHSRRFQVLQIRVLDVRNGRVVFPLPVDLSNISTLDIEISNTTSEIMPSLFGDGAEVHPTYLGLTGAISPLFDPIKPHRLDHLVVRNSSCQVEHFSSLRYLLAHAPAVRKLDLQLWLMDRDVSLAHTVDSVFEVPSLTQLDLSCDPEAFVQLFHAPNLTHFQLQQMRTNYGRPKLESRTVSTVDNFIRNLTVLEGLVVFWWPDNTASLPRVDEWFKGKAKLTTALITCEAFIQASPRVFKPTKTPALRYLVVQDTYVRSNLDEDEIARLGQKITKILDAAPHLRIMLIYRYTLTELLEVISHEHALRLTLLSTNRAHIVSVEEIVRAHNSGVDDCFEPYLGDGWPIGTKRVESPWP